MMRNREAKAAAGRTKGAQIAVGGGLWPREDLAGARGKTWPVLKGASVGQSGIPIVVWMVEGPD